MSCSHKHLHNSFPRVQCVHSGAMLTKKKKKENTKCNFNIHVHLIRFGCR